MAVTDQQIRAVLAANPNASPERIMRALKNYGIAPERFERVTGVSLSNPDVTRIDTPGLQASSPPTQAAPQSAPTGAPAPSGTTDQMIRDALAANPDATPERIARAMQNYGVTPADVRRATGRTFAENADVRQAFGQRGGYTDEQVRDAVMGRAGEQGFATQPEIQKAATTYGITDEQLARAVPQVQPGSLNQAPITTEQSGLMPAISAVGRAADVTADTSRLGQQELLGRINQVGQATGGIYDEAQGYQQQFRDIGNQAAQMQAALSGALGPEAQAQAFANYQTSPELAFRQKRGEEAMMRQAAAMGGLGGGNVRKALAQFTSDLYSADLSNRMNQLGELAQRGYGAGATSAQLGGQEAQVMAGLGRAGAATAAQMQDALSGRLGSTLLNEATMRQQAGRDIAGNIGQATSTIGGLQVGAGDAARQQLGQLTDQQLQFYNNLAGAYGASFTDQNQQIAQANLNTASALSGVGMPGMVQVDPYNLGSAIGNATDAYRLGGYMFPPQRPVVNPSGNMVQQSAINPMVTPYNTGGGIPAPLATNPGQNINFGNGVSTQSLISF